jgi:hypothetical protein
LFFVAMLAGGIILVDDRARGIHEGYFVTPLSALDLVGGLTLSATTLSMLIGTTVLGSSILIARVPLIGGIQTLLLAETSMLLLALGLILFMFTLMARVSNPMTPRALFGILNVITFFPSGALYPTELSRMWLRGNASAGSRHRVWRASARRSGPGRRAHRSRCRCLRWTTGGRWRRVERRRRRSQRCSSARCDGPLLTHAQAKRLSSADGP